MGEAAAALLVPAPRLRRLSLFGNALGDAGAGRLAEALAAEAHTGLQELDLAGCGVGAAGAARLFAVLEGGAAPALEARPCYDVFLQGLITAQRSKMCQV